MSKIMVVDDEGDIRLMMRMALEAQNHEVIEAGGGVDCLEKLIEGERPDMIFLDVMMPDMDGWKVSKLIKTNEALKDIPVCILTAKNDTLDELMSLEAGKANWHLNKPVPIKKLIETVDWLLDNKERSGN